MTVLHIENLHVSVEGKQILDGITLTVKAGEVHALMGPNGSGKSTLAYALMGHPKYQVTQGAILLDEQNILGLSTDKRAQAGIFLGFQYPTTVPGVSLGNFLRASVKAVRQSDVPVREFRQQMKTHMAALKIEDSFAKRYVNDGFSGGEKKRIEILQLGMLQPKMAMLDETDSGLDIDALKIVAEGINRLRGPSLGILLITHYQRMLNYITPDHVHVIIDGRIVRSGGRELALQLEAEGYDKLIQDAKQTAGVSP